MRVFAISDIHIDYSRNWRWFQDLSTGEYKNDILILAGDLSDNFSLLERAFLLAASRFKKVLYVPGNHELWVTRCGTKDSLCKFDKVVALAGNCGVCTEVYHDDSLSIVPMFSWYDYSFASLNEKIKSVWTDFYACVWPEAYDDVDITHYFIDKNIPKLSIKNNFVISFSHFLPSIQLMPDYIPCSEQYLYPVLGSRLLGEQTAKLKPDVHVYGHSHVNHSIDIGGTRYVNNAFGYPSEVWIAKKALLCIYEN